MTGDFLTRLASRALGTPCALQPRIEPLFSPRPPLRAAAGEEALEVESDGAGEEALEVESDAAPAEASRDEGETRPLARPDALVLPSPPPKPSPTAAPRPSEPDRRPPAPPPPAHLALTAVSPVANPRPADLAPLFAAPRPSLRPARATASSARLIPANPSRAAADLPTLPEPTRPSLAPAVGPDADVSETPPRIVERLRTLAPADRREAVPEATVPAAPIVRITIGRVEVRAAPAPSAPPPPRSASAPPALTLADYLARKAGR